MRQVRRDEIWAALQEQATRSGEWEPVIEAAFDQEVLAVTHDGQRIRKDWKVKNFMAGIEFFNRCAAVAEADGHHPDLHLEGYRNVAVELWTHAIGGLSQNDFILAAKIDQLPIELKSL